MEIHKNEKNSESQLETGGELVRRLGRLWRPLEIHKNERETVEDRRRLRRLRRLGRLWRPLEIHKNGERQLEANCPDRDSIMESFYMTSPMILT